MNQQAFLASLDGALAGMPPDQRADIASDYQRHFIDGMSRGRSEDEIARALGDPRKIALEFKAMTQVDAYHKRRSVGNFLRMACALTGLAFFNLFLLPFFALPALILFALYLFSAVTFAGGALVTTSALSGVSEIVFAHDGKRTVLVMEEMDVSPTRLGIRLEDARPVFEIPPYAIHYEARSEKESASDDGQWRKTFFGVLYMLAGMGVYWLARLFGGWLRVGAGRYLRAQLKMVSTVRSPAPASAA